MEKKYKLELLSENFCFSKFPQFAEIPSVFLKGEMCFIMRTDEELTVISPEFMAPDNVQEELGFRCVRIVDTLNLDEHGIITDLVQPLTKAGVSVNVISTFNTLYFFFREEIMEKVVQILKNAGHEFIPTM
jgi:hypothetical protein